jgi:hypothetical protein
MTQNMKRFITTALFGLSLGSGVWAAPEQLYVNYGVVTNPPTVDATSFLNQGTIAFNTVTVNSNFIYPIGDNAGYNSIPFSTKDTLYFTNTSSGILAVTNGLVFETITSTTIHEANSFVNHGVIAGFDFPAIADTYSTSGGTTAIPAGSVPVASHVDVLATKIFNDGTVAVGNAGLLQMQGDTISNVYGALAAGAVNTGGGGGLGHDPLDTTGGGDTVNVFGLGGFFVNPPAVYDLYWGERPTPATLQLNTLDSDSIAALVEEISGVYVAGRQSEGQVTVGFNLPLTSDPEWMVAVEAISEPDVTNTFFNIVIVNTNFVDLNGQPNTNITAEVRFTDTIYSFDNSEFDTEPIVKFSLSVPDVITGQTVTNAIFLVDLAGVLTASPFSESLNAASSDGYSRPEVFQLTTTPPGDWDDSSPANYIYDPNLIFEPGVYNASNVTYQVAAYGAQIGRNPAQLDGTFHFSNLDQGFYDEFEILTGSLFGSSTTVQPSVLLPDPTNEPARIELTANQVDLSNARLRAEGIVVINATNLAGTSTAGSDWGQINSQIGSTNGSLVISNFYPTNFQRLRGNIYAYTATYVNLATNNTVYPFNNTGLTNNFHYNILIVDQNLSGNFQSAIRNLSLTGTNSINVQDSLYVINQEYFNTTNLTFNSNVVFTQNAGNLMPTNMPRLKNFLNNTNATLTVDSVLDMGFNATRTPTAPAGRKYTVTSITNFGTMTATAPLFQSEFFENDGTIVADKNGSMVIEASSLGLGLALTDATNLLRADDNITLSAITMAFTNSTIVAGSANGTNLGQLLLQTTAAGQITDFASGAPSTNASTNNIWQVTDGFSLPVKPATGDLFGTEIITIATNNTVALHTWAGVDLGATSAGFADNMVIGHLKLSRQSPGAELHFTGAGAQNGMYVDYLELDANTESYTNYKVGLVIDPNLTIYFAACNVDPTKLTAVYTNRLVWVPSFSGPNSTVAVPYTNCAGVTQYCLMNASLAVSPIIGFFTNDVTGNVVPNAFNQPFVLNDPNGNCTNVFPCPGDGTMFKDFVIASNGSNDVNVEISTVGAGSISPNLKPHELALGKNYTLMATPSSGWTFAGWSASGLPGDVDTSSRALKFKLENSLVLTAKFTPKKFTLVKGDYHGLFLDSSNQPTSANSGWFTFTVGEDGAFSGRLLMGPATYVFSSKFSDAGSAQVAAKHGAQSVTVNLQLDMTGETGQVTGYVIEPAIQLLGDLAPVWTAKEPSPFAGQYNMVFTNSGTNQGPSGDSYGSLTVSKLGAVSVAGKLADGNSFSQSVPISKNGFWPFYTYVTRGEDLLLGWIAFQENDINSVTLSETNLFWSKTSSSKGYYSGGFTNTFKIASSPYANTGKDIPILTLTDPVVILSGGDFVEPLTNSVAYKNKLVYYTTNLTLRINPAVGSFTGRFDAGDGPSIEMSGVVLQNQNSAFGFFLGPDENSGSVLFQSQ